ncbi:hypothetical protein Scep_001747 [Stephania cephalantha]|uniref:ubiquitinyl hydrolase 1 n=1 Tax=Stephania cephalantha TaxID=152367 RepID=A0AAP0Q824_9MAGN
MDGPINGGMMYYEVQESKLCAVHCVNTVLQGSFFSEFDFAALASDLDWTERQMMIQSSGDFARFGGAADESHNVSMGGDFGIQAMMEGRCLEKLCELIGVGVERILRKNKPSRVKRKLVGEKAKM